MNNNLIIEAESLQEKLHNILINSDYARIVNHSKECGLPKEYLYIAITGELNDLSYAAVSDANAAVKFQELLKILNNECNCNTVSGLLKIIEHQKATIENLKAGR